MSKTHGNEPIHPVEERTSHYAEVPSTMLQGGLTKREYFAAMAMQGMCAFGDGIESYNTHTIPIEAVKMADALIEALNKERL